MMALAVNGKGDFFVWFLESFSPFFHLLLAVKGQVGRGLGVKLAERLLGYCDPFVPYEMLTAWSSP